MRALSGVSELPGSRADSLDRARAGDRRRCAEPGDRRDLTAARTIRGRLVMQRNPLKPIGSRCRNVEGPVEALLFALGVSLAHRVLDAGNRAADGHRLGRGLHARPRSAASRLVPGAARSGPVRSDWQPLPPDRGVGPGETRRRRPGATSLIRGRSCSSIATSWRGSGRSPARSRTAIPRSMRCLAWPATVLAPSWQDLPRARLGPILLFSFTAGVIFAFRRRRWGVWAAALAAGAWVFQPNLSVTDTTPPTTPS